MTDAITPPGYPYRMSALVFALPVAPLVGCVLGLPLWLALNGKWAGASDVGEVMNVASVGYLYTLPVSLPLALVGFFVLRLLGQTRYLAFGLAGLVLSPAALIGTCASLDLWDELPAFITLAVIVSVLAALAFRLLLEPFRKPSKQAIN